MNKALKLYSILLLSGLLLGCEDVFNQRIFIDIDPGPEKLVVLADFENVNSPRVLLSVSGYDMNDFYNYRGNYRPGPEAEIEVLEDGRSLGTMLPDTLSTYIFKDRFIPQSGKNYELRVNSKQFGQVWASGKIPEAISLKAEVTGVTRKKRYWGRDLDAHEVRLTFTDPAAESNYYRFSFVQKFPMNEDSVEYYSNATFYSDDLLFHSGSGFLGDSEPGSLQYIGRRSLFNDKAFDGLKKEILVYVVLDNFDSTKESIADIEVRLEHLSKDMYDYESTRQLAENNDGNPFVQPIIIHNNIKGGGLGAFNTYNIFSDKFIIKVSPSN
jgi:predicted Rdx family selenoprotein